MPRPLLQGDDHNLLANRTVGDPHPQYVSRGFFLSALQTAIPATALGIYPGNASIDYTAKINNAFASIDPGETLWFKPGEYRVDGPLVLENLINVYAYGATFNSFSEVLTDPVLTIGDGAAGTQMSRCHFAGFRITRDYTVDISPVGSAGNGIAYTGLRIQRNNRCTYQDIFVEGFDRGAELIGTTGVVNPGCTENVFHALRCLNNRYSLTLEVTGATDNVNENTFYDFEHQHSSAFDTAELLNAADGIQMVRILNSGTSVPNNNVWFKPNLEAPSGKAAYRKVRIEGRENGFYHGRYETHNTTGSGGDGYDITIGKAATATTDMTRNVFFHGQQLNAVVEDGRIEFIGTSTVNNKNQFFTGWGTVVAGGNVEAAHSFHGGSNTTPLVEIKRVSPAVERATLQSAQAPDGTIGFYGFYGAGAVIRNYLSMRDGTADSIWDILFNQGIRIQALGRLYGDTNDIVFQPLSASGSILCRGATSPFPVVAFQHNSSSAPGWNLRNSSAVKVLQAIADPGGGIRGLLEWWDTGGAPAARNSLAMNNSSPYELRIDGGLTVNESGSSTGDFRVESDTEANAIFLDASANQLDIAVTTIHSGQVEIYQTSTDAFIVGSGALDQQFRVDTDNGDIYLSALNSVKIEPQVETEVRSKIIFQAEVSFIETTPGAYPYTITTGDYSISVDTSAARTINLPATPAAGDQYEVIDDVGSAAANNITVQGNGHNIRGAASATLNTNWIHATFRYNGSQWRMW